MKPQVRRVLRSILFALLAATPLLAEHLGLRKMWTREVDERGAQRVELQANLIEARLASLFDLWLFRTAELGADRTLESAFALRPETGSTAIETSRVKALLVDVARFTAPGAEAWLLKADGTVLDSSREVDSESLLPRIDRLPELLAHLERPAFRGRVDLGGVAHVEFSAPVSSARTQDGGFAGVVLIRVPFESVDAWLAEAARDLRGDAWVVGLDGRGECVLDTRDRLLGKAMGVPPVADLTRWDQDQQFGTETAAILRSLAPTPALLDVLADVNIKNPTVKVRRILGAKLDVLLVCPGEVAPADVAFADQIVFVLAAIVALTTFLVVYARLSGTDRWIQPSVGLPAMAGLGFLLACSSATLYLTNTLDERRRDQTQSFGRLVESSLVHDLDNAIDMRRAYFAEFDDRLFHARVVREEFYSAAKLANEAFPEGFLILTLRDGDADAEVLPPRGAEMIDFTPRAALAPGSVSLERPMVYTVPAKDGSTRVVFDSPFRRVNGELDRLIWCIDLSKLLGQLFSPERTSGFDISLVSAAAPGAALFPAGVSIANESLGMISFPFPRGVGALHRLALTPRMDLFGAETSRMVVLVFGMFISVAGSVAVTLIVGSLASYRRASRIDPLTGVRNRMDFDETLTRELERARRHDRALSLVILDLDYFKRINDQFKHAAGDDVLRSFVLDLTGMLRKSDTVFRYGGEEFAVLFPETPSDAAHAVIDRVRETFAKAPMAGLERLGIVTFSAGVATWDGEESSDALIDRADAAMYEAKNGGRNRVVLSRPKRAPRLTAREREAV